MIPKTYGKVLMCARVRRRDYGDGPGWTCVLVAAPRAGTRVTMALLATGCRGPPRFPTTHLRFHFRYVLLGHLYCNMGTAIQPYQHVRHVPFISWLAVQAQAVQKRHTD